MICQLFIRFDRRKPLVSQKLIDAFLELVHNYPVLLLHILVFELSQLAISQLYFRAMLGPHLCIRFVKTLNTLHLFFFALLLLWLLFSKHDTMLVQVTFRFLAAELPRLEQPFVHF